MYTLFEYTWASASHWCNHANGGGVGSSVVSTDFWETNTYVLIICFSCNVSSPLPCIDANKHESLNGLSHHLVVKKTNTRNGRTKMHAKLSCQMDWWPTRLMGCVKHIKLRHKKHMNYDGMNGGVIN
jgi:hypothetical protein